ncbi:MAG: carboxypeptidase-like regulatory domain-containing protein [Gemmatimonadales bacterium]
MYRLSPVVAASAILLACASEKVAAPTTPPLPLPTFALSGVVQDEAGLPLSDVAVELFIVSSQATISTVSDPDGTFRFSGIRGWVKLRLSKNGFIPRFWDLVVASDLIWQVILQRPETPPPASDSIVLGATIRSTVDAAAPPCDPIGWDALAPCRRFWFTAPSSGRLAITIKWSGQPDLDATMVVAGDYIATSRDVGPGEIALGADVAAGGTYEIRVSAYYGGQTFDLKAELISE